MTSMPPVVAVDSGNKICSHPLQQLQPSPLQPSPLQPSPHNVMPPPPPPPPLMHSNSMEGSFHSNGPPPPSHTQTSTAASLSNPGFQAQHAQSLPTTPTATPVNTPGATPIPPASGTPTPTHPTGPARTPTPSSTPGCSSCGCDGHCRGNSTSTPPTYHYNYMWPHHPGVFPGGFLPGLFPVTSNGLVNPPNLAPPFTHPLQPGPPISLPNGLTQEVLYNNHHGITLVQTGGQHSPAAPPFIAPFPPNVIPGGAMGHPGSHSAGSRDSSSASSTSSVGNGGNGTNNGGGGGSSSSKAGSKAMCCNCGGTGHRAPECKETTMDAMAMAGMGKSHIFFLW